MDFLAQAIQAVTTSLPTACAAAAITGLLAHVLYFIHGHDNRMSEAARIIACHAVAFSIVGLWATTRLGLSRSLFVASALSGSYLGALFCSIGVYRLFFHRLARFPGPLVAKFTHLYSPYINAVDTMHLCYEKLHAKYGDVVRITPNNISIISLDAIEKVHGAQSKCVKANTGPYDFNRFKGRVAMLEMITDRVEHRQRRKAWASPTLKNRTDRYEPGTQKVMKDWIEMLSRRAGKPIDSTYASFLFTFDNMGMVGFSKEFGGVKTWKTKPLLAAVEMLFSFQAMLGAVSWPCALYFSLPAFELVEEREKCNLPANADILGGLLEDYNSEKPVGFDSHDKVIADAQAILVGATETLGCALGFMFWHLADPELRANVRKAIAPAFGKTVPGEFRNADLEKIPYLDGVINELLRLHTPAGTGGPRQTPPEGLMIDDVWIPGYTNILTTTNVYHQDERFFVHPKEFIPERWSTRPELVLEKRAFFPFTLGRYECPGKWIAMQTMRLAIAYVVWNLDWEYAPGEDSYSIIKKERNVFARKPGPLKCVFTERQY